MKNVKIAIIVVAAITVACVAGGMVFMMKNRDNGAKQMPATEPPITPGSDRKSNATLPPAPRRPEPAPEPEPEPEPRKTPEPRPLDDALTFSENLDTAPFPYNGNYEDTNKKFFDYTDPNTGVKYHTNYYGSRISEIHYNDSTVTFHVPAHFDPAAPFEYVVFLHGFQTDLPTSLSDYDIIEQIDACGRNVILVAPQLAKNATDVSIGKWYGHGAFAEFIDEAAAVLHRRLSGHGLDIEDRLASARIILLPFSGGYKPAAYILDRGGVGDRISGVLLLDAMYNNIDMFVNWIVAHRDSMYFIDIYNDPPGVPTHEKFKARLKQKGLSFTPSAPHTIKPGSLHIYYVKTEHLKVPLNGPPHRPVTAYLDMIE